MFTTRERKEKMNMKVRFIEKGHKYQSIPAINWTSVTRVVEKFSNHFDPIYESERCSLNSNSKWYGLEPGYIQELWEAENRRATDCGHWYHNKMEKLLLARKTRLYNDIELPIYQPILMPGYKLAPEQQIKEGIYPEHFMYNETLGVCGQSDKVIRYGNIVDIDDYKTNKKLDNESYRKDGQYIMMKGPVGHLMDCNSVHYALQLSIYMKLILLKNPNLKPGRMRLYHVTFENEGHDEYGFPILKRTADGGYVVSGGKWYTVPYLENEVNKIFKL